MKRRNFLKSASIVAAAAVSPSAIAAVADAQRSTAGEKQIYEWQAYQFTKSPSATDKYFKEALIPFYKKHGVTVGAFAEYSLETPARQYYLMVYPNAETYYRLKKAMWKDADFMKAAQSYFAETAANPNYANIETSLCEAFDVLPQLKRPDKERSILEFRLYWSPNEEANQRKIHMFNNGEVDIFNDCQINSVFYGEVLAGARNNALMYMTWYKDMPSRDAAWAKFVAHPKWNAMKNLEQYKNTATHNRRIFLTPLPYSQL